MLPAIATEVASHAILASSDRSRNIQALDRFRALGRVVDVGCVFKEGYRNRLRTIDVIRSLCLPLEIGGVGQRPRVRGSERGRPRVAPAGEMVVSTPQAKNNHYGDDQLTAVGLA